MSTRYHQAASDSYLELLKEATKRDLNLSDEDGMTPTLLAAYHGNLEALEIICSRGQKLWGFIFLALEPWAVAPSVELRLFAPEISLLNVLSTTHRGDPDRCDIWGNTPLHYAASNGHAHCVSFLINFGANIFALDNDLQSPLDAAASREQNECVSLLDKAATAQNIMNPKKVTKLKEQSQKNARKQIKECERLQEKHENKMARTHRKEESGTFSSKSTFSRSSLSNASASSTFGSLSKGIKDTFKIKFKKNKDTAAQVEKECRNEQRNVMDVFREEEEDTFSGDFKEKLQVSAEGSCVQHESILSRPGLGNIVFRRNRIVTPEDISDTEKELGFELLQRQGAAQADEVVADEEGEENSLKDDLPWDEDAMEWEEDVVDATPLEVFLQSHHLEKFLSFFMREQIDLEALLLCSDEDLQSIQMQLGPRKKVLSAINRRKQVLQQPGQLVDTSL